MEETKSEEVVPTIQEKLFNKENSRNFAFVAILILIVFGIGYFVFNHFYYQKKLPVQVNIQNTNENWKIYHNDILGIEFSYPESWGEIQVSPENITNLDTLRSNQSDDYSHLINIFFENNKIKITLFDNLSNRINSNFGYTGNASTIRTLIKSGNVCDYSVSFNFNHRSSKVTELYNTCTDGIKQSFLEDIEYFEPPFGTLYTYKLYDYSYKKAGNNKFPNVFIEYEVNGSLQQKNSTTYEQFNLDNKGKNYDSDFIRFIKSFKLINPSEHKRTNINVLPSDTNDIKIVKKYYQLLADNDYENAYSYLVNPNQLKPDFIFSQEYIYDQVIGEVNQISENDVEVFLTIQKQNSPIQYYRQIFSVKNNKIEKILEELLHGKISKSGDIRVYASERGLRSVVVLQKNGVEKIIDYRDNPENSDKTQFLTNARFSPAGKYITYNIHYYETSYNIIYDVVKDKIIGKIDFNGEFNSEENLYFVCTYNDMTGEEAAIYNVPQFTVKEDLLKLHPNLTKYMDYSCSNDKVNNIETFEFTGKYENNSYSTSTKEVYKFNSLTGEPL